MRSPSTGKVEVSFSALFHLARSGRNPDGLVPVEGLRMSLDASFVHAPVMVAEVIELFAAVPAGVILDATVGGGGHAAAVLEARPDVRVLGIDQDPDAVEAARRALGRFGPRAEIVHARFDRLEAVLDDRGIGRLAGALFDLGVSSPQLDRPERGFSYRSEGPLDMRMNPRLPRTAADIVNHAPESDLIRLLVANGEGRLARRIARAIVAGRPLTTTAALARVVADAVPVPARRRGHPARRVFQALRIAVNEELDVLPGALDAAIERLAPGARCVVLSYHSGEDRIVKERFLAAATGGCTCPPGLPCVCGAVPTVRVLTRGARKPSAAERALNHRAESARLRAVERLEAGPASVQSLEAPSPQ